MTPARLYCQDACAAYGGPARLRDEGSVAVEVHDITTEPGASGVEAIGLTRRLIGGTASPDGHVHGLGIEEEQS
ncbi:MAG: hypothetical protein ACYCS7_16175 [Acidimicrobiales bacterium]